MQITNHSRGTLTAYRMFNLKEAGLKSPEPRIDQAIRQFLRIGNHDIPDAVPAKWIEMPKAVLLFQMIPGDEASGTIYLYDREQETFYMVCFEGDENNLTVNDFEALFSEYNLLKLAEQPSILHVSCQSAGAA